MKPRRLLGLLVIFMFLLFGLFGCDLTDNGGNDNKQKGKAQINLMCFDTRELIGEPIIMEGTLGKSEAIEIPKVNGFMCLIEGPFTIMYGDPMIDFYIPYIPIHPTRPNEGIVIIKYLDEQGIFFDYDEVVGEIGSNQEFTPELRAGTHRVADPNQETLVIVFGSEIQIIEVTVVPIVQINKYPYTINYLEETTNKVLHTKLTGRLPEDEILNLEPHPVIPGYTLKTTVTTLKIKPSLSDDNVLNVYYVKDPSQWATITFLFGEHATQIGFKPTSYEVIKNHPLDGENQPEIHVPDFETEAGYKINPDGKWSVDITEVLMVTKDLEIVAQVIIDEDQKFEYTVYYKEDREYGSELAERVTGTHHLGTVIVPEHPVIPGYTLQTENREFEIQNHEYYNRFTIYYVKDPTQWIIIEFISRYCTMGGPGASSYEVIKNHPLNGRNQPNIVLRNIEGIYTGYKKAGDNDWTPAFYNDLTLEEDTTFYTNIVVDESQQYKYQVFYYQKDGGGLEVHPAKTGYHHVGNLDLGSHPDVYGYKLVEGQNTNLEIYPNDYNYINVYYVRDLDKWVTVEFSGGDHGVVWSDITSYDVIKGVSLNSTTQPKPITSGPRVESYPGYKHNTANPWSPGFNPSMNVTENTVFVAQYAVDTNVKFAYQINYLEEETERVLLNPKRDQHHIGTLQLAPHPVFSGYKPSTTKTTIEITDNTANNILNVYYAKDPTQWTTLTFTSGPDSTVFEAVFEVIKGIPFHMPIQLPITPPEITAKFGYKINPNDCWSPAFHPQGTTNEPIIYYSKVFFDSDLYTTVTFSPGENATLEGTNVFIVLKNHPFNGENQDKVVEPPTVTPNIGYQNTSDGDWDPVFDPTASATEPLVYNALVDVDTSQWRIVTIKHIGKDLTGNYTTSLLTETVDVIATVSYDMPQKSFTGFTFDTTNPATYTVDSGDSQMVEVKYTRNKHNISFITNVDITPSPINNIYYGEEVIDILVLDQTPLKTGYHIEGWIIQGTDTLVTAEYKMPDNDLVLVAKWKANTYLIHFNPNCSDYSGVMYDLQATYDQLTTLTKMEYTREGYKFLGWAIEPSGGKVYNDEHQVINLAKSGEFRLYAVWLQLYKITLILNGGTLPEGYTETIYLEKHQMTYQNPYYLPIPTKEKIPAPGGIEFYEFEFGGFFDTDGSKREKLVSYRDYTLSAKWRKFYREGYYPQSKVTDLDLIAALDQRDIVMKSATITSRGGQTFTEVWNVITYNKERYEKLGNDYYKYELIIWYLTEDHVAYTKYILDFAPFDSGEANTNTYYNSYMYHYIHDVFKAKVKYSPPSLLNKETIENSTYFPSYDEIVSYPTDYAQAVLEGKRSIIPWAIYNTDNSRSYWTESKNPEYIGNDYLYYVMWNSYLSTAPSNYVLGLRLR